MAIGKTLRMEITEWGVLAMVIVILSVILIQFKNTSTVACTTSGYTYNVSSNLCESATGAAAGNETVRTLATDLTTWVSALSEPKNWVIIVIVGIIGFALVKLFTNKSK